MPDLFQWNQWNVFLFLFIAEIEVVMTKNSVVENIEQHPQLTFSKLVPENAKLGLHVTWCEVSFRLRFAPEIHRARSKFKIMPN